MFRPNNNKSIVHRIFHKTIDGLENVLPIDQFPVKEFNINKFGFPKSDITIFDELQKSASIDISLFNAFASRISAIPAEKRHGLSDEDLFNMYRPSWIQTPSEMVSYVEWYHNEYQHRPDLVDKVEHTEEAEIIDEEPKSE